MSPTIEEQIESLKHTITEMESQRTSLGDEAIDAALAPFQHKLDELVDSLQAQEARHASQPAEPNQQRKLVTLLFMDIAGSTQLTQRRDPEDVMAILDGTLKRLAEPVEAQGGRVTRFMGDGFLSVFGAPTAREDDPERAVRAGLGILSLASEIAVDLEEAWDIQGFNVRVGISTGLVMLGGETEAEDTMMGAAVNLAARLENAAPPGGLLVSHDTYRHVRGVFDVRPWDPLQVKGFEEPVQVYRVLRAKARTFRQYTRGVEGVETRMVGRETELKFLRDALLTAVEENEGQMVTISGEAGVGKSRLLYEFRNWIELLPPPAVRLFEGRGRQEAQGQPYGLLRDVFEFRFQIQEDERGGVSRHKLVSGFMDVFESDEDGEQHAHILGQLLGVDFGDSPHLRGVREDPQQLRDRGLMYLEAYFQKLSEAGPVVLMLEDIHWADDSSLDALNRLGQRTPQQRLLVLCAARPTLYEHRPFWGEGQPHHTRLDLRPLSKRESRQLVGEILKLVDQIPPELRELVVEGAEGNPFYLEELIKMLVEGEVIVKGGERWHIEVGRLSEIEVPPTLAGVLQARLDSLPVEERVVLQQASVVGRLFWDRVVAHIYAQGGNGVEVIPEVLKALRGREMIYRREESVFADAREYLFKHDVLREVTYESVLKRLRRRYHGLVADWLIAQGAGRAGEYSGLIAEHLLQAGRTDQAGAYFLRAGEYALASYANREAEAHLRKALELSLDTAQRAACLAGLGEALGWQGRTDEADQVLRQAINIHYAMEDYDRAASLYARLSRVLWYVDYKRAWDACQEGLACLENAPQSPGMAHLLAEAGRVAYFRGQPAERVVSLCNQAIEMAENLGIVEVEAESSITLALTIDDHQEGIDIFREAAALSEAHGLLRTAARAHFNLGNKYYLTLGGVNKSLKHYLKSADISRQIGEIDQMILALKNVLQYRFQLGYLESTEEYTNEFLRRSSAAESQVIEFQEFLRGYASHFRGDWIRAREFYRAELDKLDKGGSLQFIAFFNISLAEVNLERNRFEGLEDFSDAEAAAHENIALQWGINDSCLVLSRINARRGFLREAHDYLTRAAQAHFSDQGMVLTYKTHRLQAEIELAMAEERWDEAVSASLNLIDMYQGGNYRWHQARQLIDLGDALLGRDGPGDCERAEEAFRQALEIFREMGASGYVQALEERLGGISTV
jgi:predicted ATPase/class 3 adenylate cyclase